MTVFSFLIIFLTSCLEQPDTPISRGPNSPFRALSDTVASFEANHNPESMQFTLPQIPDSLMDEDSYQAYLVVRFSPARKFKLRRMKFALNGIKGRHPFHFHLGSEAEWAQDEHGWQLAVHLTPLYFANGESILRRIQRIQEEEGTVGIWLRAPYELAEARLDFVERKIVDNDDELPRVIFKRVRFGRSAFFHRLVHFKFRANLPVRHFECSLDHRKFRKCRSPATYWLHSGHHVFRVRAMSRSGQYGPTTVHHFRKHWWKQTVKIKKVIPSASPTTENSVKVHFKVRNRAPSLWWRWILKRVWKKHCRGDNRKWGFCRWLHYKIRHFRWHSSRALCQLDEQGWLPCTSPVTYENLNEGAHTVSIRGFRYPSRGARYSWIVDQTIPEIQWVQTPPPQTSESTARFEFRANEDVDYKCAVDGGDFSSCESPFFLSDLEAGTHNVEVIAQDTAGNESNLLTYIWEIDDGAPNVVLETINPATSPTSSREIRFDFSVDEPAELYCFVDQEVPNDVLAYIPHRCDSPLLLTDLTDGIHRVSFTAIDAQGNLGNIVDYEWEVDTTGPSVQLQLLQPLSVPTNEGEAVFEFSADDAVSFSCVINGSSLGECESPYTVSGLVEGEHTFIVRAFDSLGNVGQGAFGWVVDQTPPTLITTQVVPPDAVTELRSLEYHFQASGASSVSCELDGGGLQSCQSPFLANDLAEGQHTLVIEASDFAGNISQLQYDWSVVSPVIVVFDSIFPNENPSIQNSIVFQFSSTNAQSFLCRLDGGPLQACTSPVSYSGLTDGAHIFEVAGVNHLGETGDFATHSWVIDTGPLTISQISVSQITQTTALVSWTTNVPATSQVHYGIGQTDTQTPVSAQSQTNHAVILTGLQPNSFYTFQVESVDRWNRNAQSGSQNFRTLR